MHGRQGDDREQEPGEAGELAAEVAPSDDDRVRRARASLEERIRAIVVRELGATQTSRAAKAQARRKMRRRGRR